MPRRTISSLTASSLAGPPRLPRAAPRVERARPSSRSRMSVAPRAWRGACPPRPPRSRRAARSATSPVGPCRAEDDLARAGLLEARVDEDAPAVEDGRHLVRRLRDREAAPVDADVREGGREGARELPQHLRLDPLAGRDHLGRAAPRPREALHEVVARPGADAEGEDAGRRGVLPDERDDRVGVGDLAVGEDEELPRHARVGARRRGRPRGRGRISVPPRSASSPSTCAVASARLVSS